jgi:hypothetical protein
MTKRLDGFGPIHKAIRFALSDLLVRMGKGEFTFAELEDVLAYCESHLAHEETFFRPAFATRIGALTAFDEGHPVHERYVAELRALAKSAESAAPEHRATSARALYLHFSKFVGENLAHMAEEEEVLQPLVERHFADDELLAIQGRLMASLAPPEMVRSAKFMLRALDRSERAFLVGGMAKNAPRPAVLALLDAVKPVLSPEINAELAELALAQAKEAR